MKNSIIALIIALILQGCATIDTSNETATYWIVGFGKISTKKLSSAVVVDNRALGVYISDSPTMKVGFGYSSELTTFLDPETNQLIEIDNRDPKGITITTKGQ